MKWKNTKEKQQNKLAKDKNLQEQKEANKWVTLMHAHIQKDNKQFSPRGMMIKEQK